MSRRYPSLQISASAIDRAEAAFMLIGFALIGFIIGVAL